MTYMAMLFNYFTFSRARWASIRVNENKHMQSRPTFFPRSNTSHALFKLSAKYSLFPHIFYKSRNAMDHQLLIPYNEGIFFIDCTSI